ncbi:hypothetical protein BXA09_08010 [Campylobacter upsaliensis]|uniref:Lipoprotein n=1 Tax=Campylobacter upsaliensis JV21 TaxID=888826 RepID=A0A828QVY1_CAMUP|nr:ABC-type transport auxiliary lipoprotein family protein [Campylobacter upsaliensis]EAB5281969.1 hypothetical protein [Campylobacter upsaliensis]EAH5217912.1 hypothetical protein [Campylobacter upsaliensis]EAH5848264.1 hypothetical protein [Campylobacter upsaliensis]EAH5879825.1 hypothetical protein [Campylobacter upsaliensis]EAH5903408.1 hypothetical protein [Campylobacter upsaliensis]
MMRIFTFFLLFFLSGCAKISVDKEQSLILKSYGYEKNLTHSQKTLQILKPKVPLYLNSKEIIYVKKGLSGTYAYHFWADLPSNFYRFVLLDKLEKSGIFNAVVEKANLTPVDLALKSRLESFEQIITSEGNFAKISLSVTLFDIKEQKILENEFFEVLVVLEDLQMNTLVVGFERGLNELCDKIIAWLTKFS